MTTLTLELPDALADQLRERKIAESEARSVALAALEIWLAQRDEVLEDEAQAAGRFSDSAVPFIRRLIGQNRELFQTLAKR